MKSYRLSRDARTDLRGIARYIRKDNPSAADAVLSAITQTLEFLATMPEAVPERPDLRPGLRVFPCRRPAQNYLVFYELLETQILLIAVLHGSRDWTRKFQADDE